MTSLQKINLKKYLFVVCFVVLIFIIFLCGYKTANFFKFYSFSTKPIISSFSVTQLPSVPGQPIHWVKTISISSVNTTGHLLALPKNAQNIKISTSSINKVISTKSNQLVSKQGLIKLSEQISQSEASEVLARQIAKEKATGFFASLSRAFSKVGSLFAAVGDVTLEEEAQITETVLVDLAPVVEETTGEEITPEENIPPPPLEDSGTPPNLGGESEEATTTEEIILEEIATTTPEEIATTTEDGNSNSGGGGSGSEPESEIVEEITATTTAATTASSTDVVVVEYETPAPVIAEAETDTGKIVSISSTSTEQEVITNVLAFTNIPEIFKVGQEDKIKIKWTNNGDQNVIFHAYDTDNNGKLDYVEWTVPHLSEQIFEIIFISKAFELDENKEIINDVYDTVKTQDGTFAPIPATHYIRVTFEQNLTAGKDMTIYAKGQGTITVFNENGSDSIGQFTVNGENTYKIYPNYTDSAVYDLLFSGNIDVDYIVDPADLCDGTPTDADCWSAEGTNLAWFDPANVNTAVTETTDTYDGKANTAILYGLGADYEAGYYCYNLTEGGVPAGTWYLPSYAELWDGWVALGSGGFPRLVYWSSTEHSSNPSFLAWYLYTYTGYSGMFDSSKNGYYWVRCLRDAVVSNTAPSATITTPGTWNSGDVTINYKIIDAESDMSNISQTASSGIEYSLDNSTWVDATKGTGGDATTGLTSSGTPGTSHTFVWASATDLATTSDSTVYIRVRPNDGSLDATAWATSTAFGIDNVAPAGADACDGTPVAGTICADGSVYVSSTLRTTPSDQGSYQWYNYGPPPVSPGATDESDGRNNIPLLTPLSYFPAAQACENSTSYGHNDWYLPSIGELHTLYINRVAIGNFNTSFGSPSMYWSSTERNYMGGPGAWSEMFALGISAGDVESLSYQVRCVRRPSVDDVISIPVPTFGTITASSIIVNKPAGVTDAGSGLEYWRVRRDSGTPSDWIAVGTNTYESTPLSGNTQYTYDVQFKDTAGNISSYGTSANATTTISNTAPSATITTPGTWNAGNVTINYKIIDAESDTSNITQGATSGIEYSTDNSNWYDATKGTGGDDTTGLTSSPDPGTSHTFVWASATDLGTTQDSTVYIRVRPNDGTLDAAAWATSTAFGIDNVAPAGPDACSGSATDPDCWSTQVGKDNHQWSADVNVDTLADSLTDGKTNTLILHNLSPTDYTAADYCYTLPEGNFPHGTWYLPSKDELWDGWGALGSGGFPDDTGYWSSTEYSGNPDLNVLTLYVDTYYGYVYMNNYELKYYLHSVRCLRDATGGPIPVPTFGTITTSSIVVNQPVGVTDSGSGLAYWMVRRDGETESDWIAIGTNTYESTPLSDNTEYTYDVRFKDAVGNISSYGASASETTLLADIVPPTGTITLSAGATYSTTTSPTIVLTTNDASQYQLCLNSATAGNDCTSIVTSWASYIASPAAYNFVTDGTKTLYVQFKDTAGNISATYSDDITIDTVAPTLSFTDDIAAGPGTSDTITATWGDATVKKWDYDTDGICSTTTVDYSKTDVNLMNQTNTTNNNKYICLYGEDVAGNKTTLVSANDINISSGGGNGITYENCTYTYSEWSACVDREQTRTATPDYTYCTNISDEPISRACDITPPITPPATTTGTSTPEVGTSTLPLATSTPPDEATTTLVEEKDEATSTTIVVEEDKSFIETITDFFTSDNNSQTDNSADNTVTVNNENRRSGGGSHSDTIINNIVDILDVSTFITDNVAVLGTTTEKIILGAQGALKSPVGNAVTKTITTVGVVGGGVAASGALAMSGTAVADLFFLPFKLWGILLSVLGLRKRNRPWGTVYDSVTKQPIDPAYVTITNLETKKEETSITDLDGRYGFLVNPGRYMITANKTNYIFPSKKLAGKTADALYNNLYFGEEINTIVAGAVISKNIPMDPVKFDWNEFTKGKKKLMKFYSRREKIMRIVTDWIFRIGFGISLISLFLVSAPYNLIIFGLYLVIYSVRKIGLKQRALGSLTDKEGNPLSFAIVHIFDADLQVQIVSKVANQIGKYYCLVNKGKYYLKIEKKNDDESYTEVFTSPVFEAKDGIVNKNFVI